MGDTIRLGLVILMQVPCVPLVTLLSSFAVKVPHKRSHTATAGIVIKATGN